jgi:hypothetical protein
VWCFCFVCLFVLFCVLFPMFSLSGLSIFHCLSVFSNVCSTNQQKNENTFLFDFAILLSLVASAHNGGYCLWSIYFYFKTNEKEN